MWFFYLAKTFIDIGIEAIHFGQVEAMDEHNSSSQQWETVSVHWNEVFSRVRAYAAQYARRKFVLCDAHVPRSKGLALPLAGSQPPTPPYSLLLDFHSCPLPTIQHSLPAWPTFIALTKAATLWYNLVGQSRGGYAPSGWSCQELPYLLELDNSDGKGESWGYDHISWFAQQTEDQRNAWLGYGWNWLLETDRAGHLQMPGSRYVGAPVQSWYWANTAGPAVPTGFSQEETIKGIWSVAEIPGDLNSDHIVDSRDYSMFRASLGKKRGDLGYNFTADYDGDGWVTYSDYQIWYICYKAGASP